jgi:hypothetical protein
MTEPQEAYKAHTIIMRDERSDTGSSYLAVGIDKYGKLFVEGQDLGKAPREFWGRDEYEYKLVVDEDWKDTLLLYLIFEKFKTSQELIDVLKRYSIYHRFYSRAGD